MKRRYIHQMINPNIAGPVMRTDDLPPPPLGPSKIGASRATSSRRMSAMRTGAATTSAMKIVRRDHSISPSDKSKMRRLDATRPGGRGMGATGAATEGVGVSFVI